MTNQINTNDIPEEITYINNSSQANSVEGISNNATQVATTTDQIRKLLICTVIIAFTIITIALCLSQYIHYHSGEQINLSDYIELSAEEGLYNIKSIKEKNSEYYTINGWALCKGHEMAEFDTRLVLYHEGEDTAISLPLAMKENEDITEYIGDGIDYSNTQFKGNVDGDIVDGADYLIGFLIKVDGELRLIKTGEKFEVR